MNPFAVPYPKASQRIFLWVSMGIALSIIFTLTVFQPFGTASFRHPNKIWILSGYGIVVFLSNACYFYVTKWLLKDSVVDRWSIMNEIFFIMGCLIFALVACFFYWAYIFNVSLSLNMFFGFIRIALTVAIIPMSVYFGYLYMTYRDVSYASKNIVDNSLNNHDILLKSANESEVIRTSYDELLCIKSSDNYVIIYSLIDGQSSRHMIRNTMKNIESQLSAQNLIKCHRSYLVNISKIRTIEGNITNSKLTIEGLDATIPVSRAKVPEIRKLLISS